MVLQYLPIINNGTLAVTKGHLDTRVGGIGTGTYTLATGTSLELNGGDLRHHRRDHHRRPGP